MRGFLCNYKEPQQTCAVARFVYSGGSGLVEVPGCLVG